MRQLLLFLEATLWIEAQSCEAKNPSKTEETSLCYKEEEPAKVILRIVLEICVRQNNQIE